MMGVVQRRFYEVEKVRNGNYEKSKIYTSHLTFVYLPIHSGNNKNTGGCNFMALKGSS
jgi:hypothetical protein